MTHWKLQSNKAKVIKKSDAYKRTYRTMFSWDKSEYFLVVEKFYETFKSAYTSFFLYREFARFKALMIHKYFMHFVSVRDNQNVNVKSLIIAATCNKRFFHRQIFKFRLYKQFYHYPTLFQLLEPKTESLRFIIKKSIFWCEEN